MLKQNAKSKSDNIAYSNWSQVCEKFLLNEREA